MIEWGEFGAKSLSFICRPIHLDARINILEGSVRSSKTVTMIPKWLAYIKEGPQGLLIMTGVSKDTIYDNVLRDLFDTIGEKNYSYNRQSGDLTIFGRPVKVIGAKDEGSEKYLRGKTLAGAYCDELSLMPPGFFKQLLNRLSVEGSKLYGTTNPDHPNHWLYLDFITNEELIGKGTVDVVHFELDDNPNLSDEYKDFIKSAYSGVYYKRFILGLWVQAEGAIYDMFDDDNLFDGELPRRITEKAGHYIAVDYGTQNGTVFLYIVDDGTTVWVVDEYYHSGRKAGAQKVNSQYAKDFKDFVDIRPISKTILDPAAASFKAELRKEGWIIKDGDNDVLEGIRNVATLMKRKLLKVHVRCKNLIGEIQGYVWDPKPTEKGNEKPVKKNDDCVDALRYFVHTMVPAKRIRG